MARFWLGTHMPNWLSEASDLFVSRRRIFKRKTFPRAVGPWALDSGGFSELELYGEWRTTEREYIEDVRRFSREIGNLAWVAPMDWMCEPHMLQKTGKDIRTHQRSTIENFLRLREELGALVIPVLQGWDRDDYLWCVDEYERQGVHLAQEPIVGVGSVCRRQDTDEAVRIFHSLGGLRLHGFGIKAVGLEAYADLLASVDSMAWSYAARKRNEALSEQDESLFDWPRRMLCGDLHPRPHRATSCSNCLKWALKWRDDIVNGRLEEAA